MKKILLFIAVAAAAMAMGCNPTSVDSRDYEYEAYCDSIWSVDKDYYTDVLVETDEYQQYIMEHGEWWH